MMSTKTLASDQSCSPSMFAPTGTVADAVMLLNVPAASPDAEPVTTPPSAVRFKPTVAVPTSRHVPAAPVSET
jgi:hypothetical protein